MYDLVFSNKRTERMKRHLLFWAVFYVYQVVRMSFLFPPQLLESKIPALLLGSLVWGVMLNILFSYTIIYYLVPSFFMRKKYLIFFASVIAVLALIFVLAFIHTLISTPMAHAVGTTPQNPLIHYRGTTVRVFGNPPLICAVILSFKSIKNWHLKQLVYEQLTRENTNAELQLLKAQIHPHFLFNTLNNIYSFTLTKSPLAVELVQKLSDMLSYMITDCDSVLVPVEKEIQLIEDYIGLEKVRYGDRLDIQMHINGDFRSCMIAPLLMIPFVENCFKHGASMMRGRQWMHLIINIDENDLELNLSNSKPHLSAAGNNKKGIGLLNVKKRLALLYEGKYQLNINSTDNTYSVYLKLALQKQVVNNIERNKINIPVQPVFKPVINF